MRVFTATLRTNSQKRLVKPRDDNGCVDLARVCICLYILDFLDPVA